MSYKTGKRMFENAWTKIRTSIQLIESCLKYSPPLKKKKKVIILFMVKSFTFLRENNIWIMTNFEM